MLELGKLAAFLIVGFGPSACAVERKCQAFLDTVYVYPAEVWPDKLSKMPIDSRFDAYVCGLKYFHPPPLSLARPVLTEDKEVDGFLREMIKSNPDPIESLAIVIILSEKSKEDRVAICKQRSFVRRLYRHGELITDVELNSEYNQYLRKVCAV